MAKQKAVFAKNLKDLRKDRGLTQEELAEACGISHSALQRLEMADRWPEEATIEALAKGLGVQETRLFADPKLILKPTLRQAVETVIEYLLKPAVNSAGISADPALFERIARHPRKFLDRIANASPVEIDAVLAMLSDGDRLGRK